MIRVGTAGWAISATFRPEFPEEGSGLERYAARFKAVEINSTFHRPHRPETFARWAAAVPEDFRFAVKLPRTITHEQRLVDAAGLLAAFLDGIEPLQSKLGPLLVQLPPSLQYDGATAAEFLGMLRSRFAGPVAIEPRHATWFEAEPESLLAEFQIARVAADPARVPAAAVPGGWRGLTYYRLHGSPDMYRSNYGPEVLDLLTSALARSASAETWCVFDNTTLGAATGNALTVVDRTT